MRIIVIAVALAVLAPAVVPASGQAPAIPGDSFGPRFRADGPDAEAYGWKDGYLPCSGLTYLREQRCRVGALSNFDSLFPSRSIAASTMAAPLLRAAREPVIRYAWRGQQQTLDQYLDAQPVTGFLVARGRTIVVERYQYDRNDRHRLTSASMAKTIIGLLIGIAVKEGSIRSIDDPAMAYVPGLKDTEYGRTPIKALLQMASGVAFREAYWDMSSDIYALAQAALGQDAGGSLAVLRKFNQRNTQPGESFSYSSAESAVLGLVLAGATGRTVSDYAAEKLWDPLGAEAAASWAIDGTGQELSFACFNAVLRDWARLGLMLAHDGTWQGRSIVPRDWLLASTTAGRESPSPVYGFQIWLLPISGGRVFSLRGYRGQWMIIDPEAKQVLVQTAVRAGSDGAADQELFALWSGLSRAH